MHVCMSLCTTHTKLCCNKCNAKCVLLLPKSFHFCWWLIKVLELLFGIIGICDFVEFRKKVDTKTWKL